MQPGLLSNFESNPGAYTGGGGSGSGAGSGWLGSLFDNAGEIIGGVGSLVTAFKLDPNTAATQQNSFMQQMLALQFANQNKPGGTSPIVWIVLAVVAVIAIFFAVKMAKK